MQRRVALGESMGHRTVGIASRLLIVALIATFSAAPTYSQSQRKEVDARKAIKLAEPTLLPIVAPGTNLTYRITLKKGYRFDPDNGDGINLNNVTGNLTEGASRFVSNRVAEVDITTANDGTPGSATIRINITLNNNKLRYVRAGIVVANPTGNELVAVSAGDKVVTSRLAVGSRPIGIATADSGTENFKTAFVANFAGNTVTAIDIPTQRVVRSIPVGGSPSYIAVAGVPGVQTCFVTNTTSNSVTIFDAQNFAVLLTVPVGLAPVGITMIGQPGVNQQAWVANSGDDTVSVIDVLSATVVATIPVGNGPTGIVATGLIGSQIVAVTEALDNSVALIDALSGVVKSRVAVGSNPIYVTSGSPELGVVYVANQGSDSVSVVDTTTSVEKARVRVGSRPSGLALSGPSGNQELYVANTGDQTVSAIDGSSFRILATIPVGGRPRACYTIGGQAGPIILVTV